MKSICAKCTACPGMPSQASERILVYDEGRAEKMKVLVIDDAWGEVEESEGWHSAQGLLGHKVEFDYTSTIRCDFDLMKIEPEVLFESLSHCSVWTNLLLEGRSVIITTKHGCSQMKVGVDKSEGDAFKVGKLGIVLIIPPIKSINSVMDLPMWKKKVQRVLKAGGVI